MDQNNPENGKELQSSHDGSSNNRPDVMDLLRDSIRADGCIDGRSTFGRSLAALKDMIKADRFEAAETILINDVAMLSTLEKAIECYVLSNPGEIFQDNGLNPLFGVSLFKFMEAKHRALNQLLNLKNKKGKKNRDLSDITFD